MISHQEAEVLTSARQDAPLDPMVERELQAHLATCDPCRGFAAATERLTYGIKAMPYVPANPRIKREVMGRVRAGRGPFAGLVGGVGTGFQPGPAIAAVALIAVIGIFGWFALDRLFFDEGGDPNNQLAAVPTEQVTRELSAPTETIVPTAVPTQPQPTATGVPPTETAVPPTTTTAPEPTVPPTEVPQPTATTAPDPTATTILAPTATTAPEPTATTASEPTAVPTEEEGPVDLTRANRLAAATETAAAEPTTEPTALPPTVVPTATDVPIETEEATETEVPTPTPTEELEPTPTETEIPEPSPTPAIEPMEGSTSIPVDSGEAIGDGTGSAGTEEATQTSEPASIELTDGEPASIELIDPDGQEITSETTPEATADPSLETLDSSANQPLADVSERYAGIVGDPSGDLGLTQEGRLEFMSVPDGASMTTPEGYRLQTADAQPGVVQVCGDDFCEPGMEVPESEGWQGDVPLGVTNGTAYILRMYGDRSEIIAAQPQDTQLVEANTIAEIGPTPPPAAVYQSGGALYAWLPSGEWLQISDGSAQTLSGAYTDPANVRFAPSPNGGPLIGYFSGGTLIVAPVSQPDAAIFSMPADGVDFDISPPGDRVAVIRGNSIVIYDIQGNELTVYEGGDMQPGSMIWLNSGIIWVDRVTGSLYQIPETGE